MRLWNLPMTQRRRLIIVETEMDAEGYFSERIGNGEIGRRSEHRIAAEDDEGGDRAGVHVRREIAERLTLIDGLCFGRLNVGDRAAAVAERGVHRMRKGMHSGRL